MNYYHILLYFSYPTFIIILCIFVFCVAYYCEQCICFMLSALLTICSILFHLVDSKSKYKLSKTNNSIFPKKKEKTQMHEIMLKTISP